MAVNRVRAHRAGHFLLPHLHARLTLLETIRTTTYHPNTVHGTGLRDGVFPLIPLLQAFRLLRGHPRLL